jgi:hypothetical protein
MATVWLELPGHVPVDTPYEVAFSLDEDGVLKKVQVALLDGSAAKIETYLDRGDGLRSRLEKRLEQLKRRSGFALNRLNPKMEDNFDDLYTRVITMLNVNDTESAAKLIARLESILA